MRISLTVDCGDGPETVTTDLWAIVSWERKTGRKLSMLGHSAAAEDLAFFAHHMLSRRGPIAPLDEWMRTVVNLEEADEPTEEVTPTKRARPAEPSP